MTSKLLTLSYILIAAAGFGTTTADAAFFAKPVAPKAAGGKGSGRHELSGNYCGSYMANMVSGKVSMNPSESTFDLTVKAFSNPEVGCKGIKYALDAKSGKVSVPDAGNPSSCLGDMLASGGLGLDVSFDSSKGSVRLDLGIAKLNLARC